MHPPPSLYLTSSVLLILTLIILNPSPFLIPVTLYPIAFIIYGIEQTSALYFSHPFNKISKVSLLIIISESMKNK